MTYNSLADSRSSFHSLKLRNALILHAMESLMEQNSMFKSFEEPEKVSTPTLLGCWVNGLLKFQSRDHDAIYEYADRKMRDAKRPDVWVAPVGSFVDDKSARKADARKIGAVHNG